MARARWNCAAGTARVKAMLPECKVIVVSQHAERIYIERGRGAAYDPLVADACLKLFREKGYAIPA